MTVFLCAKCSTELTPNLIRLHYVPEVADDFGRTRRGQHLAASTIPQGNYAIEPEPWGAPFVHSPDGNPVPCQPRGLPCGSRDGYLISAGPRNTVVIHPDDAPLLQPLPGFKNSNGCCGPDGMQGPNRACPCGTALATLAADCEGPYELHLDPVRVFPLD
ncbi:hypothetical protein [Krasilnikovia sp. M28-CT-15]|uniref:hypothetical protein n=1 Tax=Krasilnikovia sp. M28-CT-15 TaxID=3373540 RepID=UPI0038769755